MAEICVIGLGYVGIVTATCLASMGHKVIGVDKDSKKVERLARGIATIYEPGLDDLLHKATSEKQLSFSLELKEAAKRSEIIFICVGTPTDEEGNIDLSQVEEAARELATTVSGYKLIVEKSTVQAGTAEKIKQVIKLVNGDIHAPFDVASNPEFLKEGSAISDFMRPDRIVLGVESEIAKKILLDLYQPFDCPILVTDIATAELIKHASNAFLAMKISYINFIADICERVGADVTFVAEGMGYDKRIGRQFLAAGAGYGGSCFPKDVKSFASMASSLGVGAALLEEVDRINQRRINSIVGKLEEVLWVCRNKVITVYGLAFKSNTDDTRESPGINLVRELSRKGSIVKCYDPRAIPNARMDLANLNATVVFANGVLDAADGSDALVFMTEWPEFSNLDFSAIRSLMRTPVIIDARNMLQAEEMEKLGFWYKGMGKPQRRPQH